jgi:hypothetical protein
MMMERVGDRWEKMEGSCATGQSPQWAVVPVEDEEKEEEEEEEEEVPLQAWSGPEGSRKLKFPDYMTTA